MKSYPIVLQRALVAGGLILLGCAGGDDTPTAASIDASAMHSGHGGPQMSMSTVAATAQPFTFRAPLVPFELRQKDFLIRQASKKDIVIQQSLFASGAGIWHNAPRPELRVRTAGADSAGSGPGNGAMRANAGA
jgi:hypothetical protein